MEREPELFTISHIIWQGRQELDSFCQKYQISDPLQFIQQDPDATLLAFYIFNSRSNTDESPLSEQEIHKFLEPYDGDFLDPVLRISSQYIYLSGHPVLSSIVQRRNAAYESIMDQVQADRARRLNYPP